MSEPTRALPPQAQQAVDRFTVGARELTARAQQARAAIRAAVGTAGSPDGTVTATVDIDGSLTDLRLNAAAADRGLDALARTVVATARRAHRAAVEQAAQAVAETAGADSAAVEILRGR